VFVAVQGIALLPIPAQLHPLPTRKDSATVAIVASLAPVFLSSFGKTERRRKLKQNANKQGERTMQTYQSREQTKEKSFDFGPKASVQATPVYAQQQQTTQPQRDAQSREKAQETSYAPQAVMPVKSFRSGAICVSIWENESLSDEGQVKSYKTVSFDRRYKDKNGVWKSSSSLRANDLPKAVLILQKAYEYLVLTETHDEEQNQ
jgi:hypothetical protein